MLLEQAELGDCEAVDDWSLAQDVNAWSSLGYTVAGLVVIAAVGRRRVPRVFLALGVAIVVEGVGSVLYHGAPGDMAQLFNSFTMPRSSLSSGSSPAGTSGGWPRGPTRVPCSGSWRARSPAPPEHRTRRR
jgi:hypothetical protein